MMNTEDASKQHRSIISIRHKGLWMACCLACILERRCLSLCQSEGVSDQMSAHALLPFVLKQWTQSKHPAVKYFRMSFRHKSLRKACHAEAMREYLSASILMGAYPSMSSNFWTWHAATSRMTSSCSASWSVN